jgi:uncharacterized protein (TIGR03084 family)
MQQVQDFLEESDTLATAIASLEDSDWDRQTQFKDWTINDVIVHLYFWNLAADNSLNDPNALMEMMGRMMPVLPKGGLRGFENAEITLRGRALFEAWQTQYRDMAARWMDVDPKTRVKWVGPDMSVRSSITARQMETWAHGHEVFDLLGLHRAESDRIRNIVVLGVNTFGWTHKVHGLEVPEQMPHLRLTAPSGEIWEYGDEESGSSIAGQAVEFAQVVTQTRSLADMSLHLEGEVAETWMAHAQCFAGPPETPPVPGSRYVTPTAC